MKTNKLLALLLSFCLLLNFSACGDRESENADTTAKTEITTESTDESTSQEEDESVTSSEDVSSEEVTEEKKPTSDKAPLSEDIQSDSITPLLYKVTDDNGHTIWLFGSIHVGKDYFYPLPDYVMKAYNGSDALAVEADVVALESDYGAMTKAVMKMMYTDGSKISNHIPSELYEEAKAILKDQGIYNVALDYYCPVMWSTFIDSYMMLNMDYDPMLGIDYSLLNAAHKENKKIIEIESAEFQYGMLAGFSEELQILLLEESVESYNSEDEYKQSMEELVDAWSLGNEAEFSKILTEEGEFESPEEEALYKEYTEAMVTERNISMADFAEDTLKSGEEVFIVVGAAHIVGEGAMADLLAERGYTVEIIKG